MGPFAWRNLLTRPLRTTLALVGLAIPILGVIGVFSASAGIRVMVGDTLGKVTGVMVLRDNVPSPVLSHLPASHYDKIKLVTGVRIVAPEVWDISPPVDGTRTFKNVAGEAAAAALMNDEARAAKAMTSLLDMPLIQGQDIPAHQNLRSGVYPTAVKEKGEGRFLEPRDVGTNHVVISKKLSKLFKTADGVPKGLGDTLQIGGKPFEIIGLYDTGSMLLDVVIVMDIGTARDLLKLTKDNVSTFYVEMEDPTQNDAVSLAIEKALPDVDARSMKEFMANFGMVMEQLDVALVFIVGLMLVCAVVNIINTMLMSTTERFIEFGVLRTNGWSRGNVLALVTSESAMLGLASGAIGCLLAWIGTTIGNQFLGGGFRLAMGPKLVTLGIGLSLVTGTLGGLYPAWRASRLVPMDAIRLGSH